MLPGTTDNNCDLRTPTHFRSLLPKQLSTSPPSRPWQQCHCCSTAAASDKFKTSPRRSAPPSPGGRGLTQLDQFIANVNGQSDDIIAATESLNNFRWSDRRTKTGPGQRPHDDPRCVGSAEGRT